MKSKTKDLWTEDRNAYYLQLKKPQTVESQNLIMTTVGPIAYTALKACMVLEIEHGTSQQVFMGGQQNRNEVTAHLNGQELVPMCFHTLANQDSH